MVLFLLSSIEVEFRAYLLLQRIVTLLETRFNHSLMGLASIRSVCLEHLTCPLEFHFRFLYPTSSK